MAYDWKTELPGVFSRHADNCPVRDGRECACGPLGYRASTRNSDTNRRNLSPVFETVPEALAWQRDQGVSQNGSHPKVDRVELGALIDEFLQAAEDGIARDLRGLPYTRESLRALRGALSYVDSELGPLAAQDVRRRHVQGLVTQLRTAGLAPARISAIVDALGALYSYAIRRDLVGFSPVVELDLLESEQVLHAAPANPAAETPGPWTTGDPWAAGPQVGEPLTPPPSADPWTPPPFATPAEPWTPPPYAAPPDPRTQQYPYPPPGYATGQGGGYPTGGYATPPPAPPPPASGYAPFTTMFGTPGQAPNADYDATMQERWLWWTVRIVVIVFVLIALVLVAESV